MPSQSHWRVSAFVLCVFCTLAFAQEKHAAGDIEITTRDYLTWGKETGTYEVGTFYVRENRSEPDSRIIGIGFSRFKARNPKGLAPVFFLPGGPGNTYLEAEGDDPQLRKTPFFIHPFTEDCDAVFVDQRGWSRRGERLTAFFAGHPPKPDSGVEFRVEDSKRAAEKIVSKYSKRKEDLRGYTVLEMVEDVNELRQKLGYDKISLRGQSFGSQWSFAIMRKHPEIVERALLSGVEPLDHAYDMPTGLLNAAKCTWKHVDKDPRFAKYLPPGGMVEVAETVIKRLEEEPIKVTEPGLFGLGNQTAFIIGPDDFPWREPVQLLELYHNQTKRWAKKRGQMFGKGNLLIHLVDSSMGVTPERLAKLRNDPAVRYTSTREFAPMIATAKIWPSEDIGDELRQPVKCDIPVVFVNGDWDMNTPIENMHEIAPFFPNSHSLTVHQAGHGTINSQMYREHPKVLGQLLTFLRTGSMEGLPTAITFKPYRDFEPPTFEPATTTQSSTDQFVGEWGLDSKDHYGSWLRVIKNGEGKLESAILWRVGSARKARRVEVNGDQISLFFNRNRKANGKQVTVEQRYDVKMVSKSPRRIDVTETKTVNGKQQKSDPQSVATGGLIPELLPAPDLSKVKWGPEIELFNGKDLTGWSLKPKTAKNGWGAKNGELVNVTPKTDFSAYGEHGNLRTDAVFKDHRLHIEFNVEENCNSGVYIRGLYEAQVVDRDSRMQGEQGVGAIFGRIPPSKQAGRVGGKWQTYDIWLVDRHITVVLNGEKVIDNKPLEGCTGGAMLGDVTKAGPLFLQGDHTSVRYRNIWVHKRIE